MTKRPIGRPKTPELLRKVPFSTRLPRYLKDWLVAPEQLDSAPILIEWAIFKTYRLKRPKLPKGK